MTFGHHARLVVPGTLQFSVGYSTGILRGYTDHMTPIKTLMTAEEFENYPFEEDKRYELDEGEFIETTRPAFRHNDVLLHPVLALGNYLPKTRVGLLLLSENLYSLSQFTRRAPDAAVILGDRREELESAKVIPIIPEIVAEILSPSETTRMIHRKLRQYFAAGVKEVWLIDPDERDVEIWTGPTLPDHALAGSDVLASAPLPGLGHPLAELFD
jgi:Uma2 family endonuclease